MQVILGLVAKLRYLFLGQKIVYCEMSSNAPLRLQLNGLFPYKPNDFSLLNNLKFQPAAEINPKENRVEYHVI